MFLSIILVLLTLTGIVQRNPDDTHMQDPTYTPIPNHPGLYAHCIKLDDNTIIYIDGKDGVTGIGKTCAQAYHNWSITPEVNKNWTI